MTADLDIATPRGMDIWIAEARNPSDVASPLCGPCDGERVVRIPAKSDEVNSCRQHWHYVSSGRHHATESRPKSPVMRTCERVDQKLLSTANGGAARDNTKTSPSLAEYSEFIYIYSNYIYILCYY